MSELMVVQAEIAGAIAQGIERKLRPDPQVSAALARPVKTAARQAFLRGDYAQAVQIDPTYSSAFAISCLGWHELCAGHEAKALEETRRALALDPNDIWGLMTLGWIYEQKGMYQEALASQRRSWDSSIRNASLAHVFARSGDRPAAEKIL